MTVTTESEVSGEVPAGDPHLGIWDHINNTQTMRLERG